MKNLFILVCLLFTIHGFSQKVKIKDAYFNCEEIQIPFKFLETNLKTYDAEIAGNTKAIWAGGLSEVDLKKEYLKLAGFQHVKEKGDFSIQLILGEMKISKEELKDITKVKKGEKPKERTYQFQFSYTFPIQLRILPMGLSINPGKDYNPAATFGFSSPTFKSSSEAYKNKRSYMDEWKEEEMRRRITIAAKAFHKHLNANYGYPKKTVRYHLMYAKTKKAPQYKPLEEEVMAMTKKLSKLQAYEAISPEFIQEIKAKATEWGAKGDELSKDDKNLKKLKGAYLYNAMIISYIIDDFENTELYANKLIEAEREEKKAKRYLKRATKIKEQLPQAIVTGRHFAFEFEDEEITDTSADDREEYFADKEEEERRMKLGLHGKAAEFKGQIVYKDDTKDEGTFIVDYTNYSDVVFFPGGNLSYFHEKEGGSIVRQGIDWTKVKSFSIGNRSFITGRRKGIRSGGELDVKVLEILKQTDRMTLFMRHPYSRKDMGMNISFRGDYHIQKAGDELQNLNSVSYNVNFKKKFSKYVSDCPQLSERVLSGEFKVKKEDLVRIVDAYNTCQ